MKKILIFLCVCIGLYAKNIVSLSIAPQEFLLKQIAGDLLEINTLVGANDDPHSYEPKPKQIKSVEKSDIYFQMGIEFENIWVERFKQKYKNIKFINSASGIKLMENIHHHHDHDHHHHHDSDHHHDDDNHHHDHHHHDSDHHDHDHHAHYHGKYDTHIWLDPVNMQIMAQNITKALIEEYPQNKSLFEKNSQKLIEKLQELDKYNKQKLQSLKDKPFMVYHPSWGYYAKRYGLKQIAVEIDGKEPKAKDLEEFVKEALEHNIKVIFISPQFSSKSAKAIAQKTGAKVYQIDQLSVDYINEMKKMTDAIVDSFK